MNGDGYVKNKVFSVIAMIMVIICFAGCACVTPDSSDKDTTKPTETATAGTTVQQTTATEKPTTVPVETTQNSESSVETQPVYVDDDEDEDEDLPYMPVGPIVDPDDSSSDDEKNYKYVAFTFDDGPHYELTYMFVDKLAEYGGKATFFVVGNRLDSSGSAAIKYAYDMGNEIAVHGYTHTVYYDSCSDAVFKSELSKTSKAIQKAIGVKPTLMRPIGGMITYDRVQSCGYDVIQWNVDTNDWQYASRGSDKNQNIKRIYNNIIRDTDANDIVLMHEIYYNSYDAFSLAIDKLYNEGYRFVTVSQLLGRNSTDNGNLYYSGN